MKKVLMAIALASATLLTSMQATAAPVNKTANFNVNIGMTSVCAISTGPTDISLTYTSFGAAATGSSGFGVTCTNSLPFTMSLDGSGTAGAYTYTDTTTNLGYTLTLSKVSDSGTGAEVTYSIGANMGAGQSGTCATAGCNNTGAADAKRTLTITY